MRKLAALTVAFAFTLSACSNDPIAPTTGEVITLTAAQAAALVAKVESFGEEDASLAALSDTIDVVIKAGAQARQIDVTTDIGAGPYWAVALQMHGGTSTSFHVIAFNEPTNPTRFIILGGASLGSAQPVNSNSGNIGTDGNTSRTGHLYSVSGGQLSAWHVSGGTLSFTANSTSTSCPGFTGPGTCVALTMDAAFNFTTVVPGNGTTGQRTASATVTAIPGVRLSM